MIQFTGKWYKPGVQTKTILLLFAVILFALTNAPAPAQTQTQMNEKACDELKSADSEMNRIYRQVLAAKATDAGFVKAFREAQRAWISFRDAHVRSIFSEPDPRTYGSVYPMCHCIILEQITTARARELQHLWIDGLEEGDACRGSCALNRSKNAPGRKE